MIDDANPFIDVDSLMAKVNEQIDGHYAASLVSASTRGALSSDVVSLVAGIEEALQAAESASVVRTSLGKASRYFGRLGPLKGLALRILAFIQKDQRNVNVAMIEALRKSMRLNVRLAEEIDRLRVRPQKPPR